MTWAPHQAMSSPPGAGAVASNSAGPGTAHPSPVVPPPPAAYAAALACLPGVGPAWLFEALSTHGPERAWALVLAGKLVRPPRARAGAGGPSAWSDAARRFDVSRLWWHCQSHGIDVKWAGSPGYPNALVDGPAPAGVLFVSGRLAALEGRPVVAIVGTRRCSPEGASVAYQLGYELSAAGVCVVSGLALGIDGAAHAGALAALADLPDDAPVQGTTVGVAASGVDVAYPRQHAALWRQVASVGAVISETPPGSPAQAWRFPSRNRIIAGLAQMVVVVECHAAGGSWHTVDAALRRGTEVGAVPGPVHSSASVGTNTLLHEGATTIRGAQDVLDALGLFGPSAAEVTGPGATRLDRGGPAPAFAGDRGTEGARQRRGTGSVGPPCPGPAHPGLPHPGSTPPAPSSPLAALDSRVLGSVGWQPLCLDEIVERSGLPVTAVVVALDRLEGEGRVAGEAGWWRRRAR